MLVINPPKAEALSTFIGCSSAIAMYPKTNTIIIIVGNHILVYFIFKYTVVEGKAKSDLCFLTISIILKFISSFVSN